MDRKRIIMREYICDQILYHIQNISFENPVFSDIINEYIECRRKGEIIDYQYFINNENQEIRNLVLDIISDSMERPSDQWKLRYKIAVPNMDEDRLKLIESSILKLKAKIIKKLCKKSLMLLKKNLLLKKNHKEKKIYI